MTETRSEGDEALLADLFDTLLQNVLDGETPDPATLLPERPDLQARVRETFDLACAVAGRREPGRPVLGGYEILRELGRGGMGTVYLARHEALGRQVAIKVLPQSLALSERTKRRFLDEARALARLRHINIVHIHRIVEHTEMLAFEMEYVDGPSLQHLLVELKKHGPRPQPQQIAAVLGEHAAAPDVRSTVEYFVRLGIAIARALAEVHRHGLVHRDVKPSNILLRRDGTPVLADFGLARDGDLEVTQTVSFAGTPIYAAPERLRDGDLGLDGRADVYSLGVTLYEAITLTPPYQGRSTQEVLRKIENGQMVPLRQRAPHVSRDLQTVLQKAMDPDPRHRYATAADFADDLERLLTLQPIRARPKAALRRLVLTLRRQRKALLGAVVGAGAVTAALWPWFATVQAASTAPERAARAVRAAHVQILQPQCLNLAGRPGRGGRVFEEGRASLQAQIEALQAVSALLDEAGKAVPDDPQIAAERAVLATALWLRSASPDSHLGVEAALHTPEFVAAVAGLPPLARSAANLLVAGPLALAELRPRILEGAAIDRFALGLLAALVGETAVCECAWVGLEAMDFDHPLLDAGLGLLAAADGSPERAYPRLFHATRTFPGSALLEFELAAAALASGDQELARQWLASAAADPARLESIDAPRRLCLEADLLAAKGDRDAAERTYRSILQQRPADPTARHRLATLAIERGDLVRARAHLQHLVQEAPEFATGHLDLARLALHAGDRPAYLQQARYALAHCLEEVDSRTDTACQIEILRLGGLTGLLADVPDRPGPQWRRVEPAAPPWSSPAERARIEGALRVLVAYGRGAARARQEDQRPVTAAVGGCVAAALQHQGLLWPLGPAGRIAFACSPWLLLDPRFQLLASGLLLPFQRSLGTPLHYVPIHVLGSPLPLERSNESLGALATVGEIDGTEELLVSVIPGAQHDNPARVEVRAAATGDVRRVLTSPSTDMIFGYALCDVGDVDGDSFRDFAVGSPLQSRWEHEVGRVQIYSGRDHVLLRELQGDGIGFGVAIANLGDVDGDGVDDCCVGTSPELRNSTAQGTATVFSGASGASLRTFHSDRAGVWFGSSVANAGDLDRDGCDDVVIGGNHGDAPGLVRVHSSRTGAQLHTLVDDADGFDFGRRVLGIPDADSDGVPDLVVTSPEIRGTRQRPGRALIYSGRSGQRVAVLTGDAPGDTFGAGVCALADWRGDGRPALAVAAVRQGVTGSGYVRVFDLATRKPLQTFFLPAGWQGFGQCLAVLGDHRGRGRPRLAAGALFGDSGAVWDLSYTLDGK